MAFLFSGWQPAAVSPHYYSYKVHQKGSTILLEGYNGIKRMSMVSFVPQPVEVVDFIPLNYYACMAETSPVTQRIIVEIFRENGTAHILKDRLSISTDDKVEERKLENDDDLNTVLWEEFGIRTEEGGETEFEKCRNLRLFAIMNLNVAQYIWSGASTEFNAAERSEGAVPVRRNL